MENGRKAVEEMSIEELREEVKTLRTHSVYFLQTEDFASVLDEDDVKTVVPYTEEEMDSEELQEKTYHALRGENFSIHEWAEQISESLEFFDRETIRLLSTMKSRYFSEE